MAAPAPLGSVDDPSDAALTLADPLGALVLALMSRLLASRAVGAVAEGDGLRVEVVKGRLGVSAGDRLAMGDGDLPEALAEAMKKGPPSVGFNVFFEVYCGFHINTTLTSLVFGSR